MNARSPFGHRQCPLCGAPPPPRPDTASGTAAEAMTFEDLVPMWNGFFKDKVFFSYVRCPGCDLVYAPIFFDQDQLASLYAQMPPNMDVVPLEALRRTQRGYFDVLRRHGPLEGDYVEVGPDIGLFTENCVREAAFSRYWLFEPNREVLPALARVMGDRPHQVVHDMFGFSAVPDGTVGAAVMIQVLDHLLDPVATLRDLRAKMRPGGKLLIVTHNEASLLRRIFKANWPAFCVQHPEVYSPRSMRALVKAAGFELVEIRRTVNYFTIEFLFKHLLWACGLKVQSTPRFFGATIGLKLGNMITVARS